MSARAAAEAAPQAAMPSPAAPRGVQSDAVAKVPFIRPELQLDWPLAELVGADAAAVATAAGTSTSTSNRPQLQPHACQLLVQNHTHVAQGEATADVQCALDGAVQWRTLVEDLVSAAAVTKHFAALALHDRLHSAGSLQVLNGRGQTIFGPFMTDHPVAMLAALGEHVAALLTNGRLQIWRVLSGQV